MSYAGIDYGLGQAYELTYVSTDDGYAVDITLRVRS